MEDQTIQNKNQTFHKFEEKNNNKSNFGGFIYLIFMVIVGVLLGYLVFKMTGSSSTMSLGSNGTNGSNTQVSKGMVFGTKDLSSFPDTAEGVMQKGGINNEGQYHLVRPGGDSQNVYLTSSVVDLSMFINHKVKVHGATQKAQSAGWLMDVGEVEVEK